jgi:hypothetical protein
VHELLGISSYVITYLLLRFHVIHVRSVVAWLGWTEDDLKAKGINLESPLITFAMTVVLVKGMDMMVCVLFFLSSVDIFICRALCLCVGRFVSSSRHVWLASWDLLWTVL